jgi:putative ABC transport system ATP-binding protein
VEARLAPGGVGAPDLRRRALDLLGEVGLAERAEHLPAHLSGGEQQRSRSPVRSRSSRAW